MNLPRYRPTVTLGNLLIALQLLLILVGVGNLWGTTAGKMSGLQAQTADQETRMRAQDDRLRILERDISDRLARIETLLQQRTDTR